MQIGKNSKGYGLHIAVAIVVATVLCGCDIGNGSEAQEDGTVTVEITGLPVAPSGHSLTASVYPAGASGPPNNTEVLALNVTSGVSDVLSVTLNVFDTVTGTPTSDPWVGDAGWGSFDLYVVVEDGGAPDQLFNAVGDRANGHPGLVRIGGDQTVVFDFETGLQEFQP
jgi:hypothetical protein